MIRYVGVLWFFFVIKLFFESQLKRSIFSDLIKISENFCIYFSSLQSIEQTVCFFLSFHEQTFFPQLAEQTIYFSLFAEQTFFTKIP